MSVTKVLYTTKDRFNPAKKHCGYYLKEFRGGTQRDSEKLTSFKVIGQATVKLDYIK
jgi:hypothetical protein